MSARIPALLCCSASFLLIAPEPSAFAQQSAQGLASAAGLEEIVVTARRREEKLQTVPVAITALTPQQIQEKGIESASDLAHYVPSLASSQQTRDEQVFYLRGQGPNGGQGGSPGVVAYFAEVPFTGSGPGIYFDLDNLQILRGPQGILFGRNTTGGAVLFEPKKPVNDFEGYVQLTLGDYDWHALEGAVNVPIIDDKLLVRVAGNWAQRDGFTQNITTGQDMDNRDYWAGRVGVTWRPSDDFENFLLYDTLYSHTNGTGIQLVAVNPDPGTTNAQTFGLPALKKALATSLALGPRAIQTAPGEPGGLDKTYSWGITDIAKYDLSDNITFKNIFGYREIKNLLRYSIGGSVLRDIDFITPGGWNQNNAQYTDEFQIQGRSLNGKLSWIAGAFYEFLHPAGYTEAQIATSTNIAGFVVPITVINNNGGQNALGPEGETQRDEALFLHGEYDLSGLSESLDGFKLTAGVRYTWDYHSNSNFQTIKIFLPPAFGGSTISIPCNPCIYKSHTFQALTWTGGLDYQITPDTLVYVKGSRGFKGGGFNGAGSPPFSIAYDSEFVNDVEVGIKSDWDVLGMKARTNADMFHDDYRNAQRAIGVLVQLVPPPSPKQATTLIANGNAEIQGLEFEGTLIPFDGLELTASWSYIDAHYTKLFLPTVGDISQLPYPFTPKNKFGFTARYHLPFIPEEWANASLFASYVHTGRIQYATGDIEPFGSEPGYGLVDLRLDIKDIAEQPIDASFFVTNATDNLYRLGNYGIYTSSGTVSFVYGEPRMFGFQLRYRFGGSTEREEAQAQTASYTPPPAPVRQAPKSYLVFFDFDKSALTPEGRNIVDQAAASAGPTKVTRIMVTGHTDTVGSDAYNMRLSKRRAESVATELEAKGIPSGEITLVAKGKRDLLVPTADGVREPQNRRVEVVYGGGPTS